MWHGGASYSAPSIPDDVEIFPSLADAVAEFDNRAAGRALYHYADGRTDDTETDAVSRKPAENGGPTMTVWHYDPREERDPYPDRVIEFGPKGGILVKRC